MTSIEAPSAAVRWNLVLFTCYQFFSHLEFFNGLFVVDLLNKGVPLHVIHLCLMATTAARTLGEFPSGYLGDQWGDRPMLLWGLGLMVTFALSVMYVVSSWALIGCFVIHGLSIAATSGADDGMLYRSVLRGNDKHLIKIRPWMSGANYLSLSVATLLGGAMAQKFGWSSIYWGFCLVACISVLALMGIQSESIGDREQDEETVSFKALFSRLGSYRYLYGFVASLALFEACANLVFVYAQAHYNQEMLPLWLIGISMALIELVSALGAISSGWVQFGRKCYLLCGVAATLGLIVAATSCTIASLVGFLMFIFVASLFKVMAETILVTQADAAITATVLSMFSLLIAFFTGLLHLIMAAADNRLSVPNTLLLLAWIAGAAVAWSMTYGLRMRKSHDRG